MKITEITKGRTLGGFPVQVLDIQNSEVDENNKYEILYDNGITRQ